jgi:tetratricopeptide (TPR) repeat protein
MVDLLSMKLDGAAGLHSVDPRALLRFTSQDGGTADPERGRLVAEHFGAGRFVLGSIVEAGGRMQVSATVYDAGGKAQSSVAATAESEAGVFEVADRLARHILAEAQASPFDARATEQTTTSLPALKAYLEGERELRAGRWESARDAFRRATELDTSFAFAFYRLAWEDPAAVDHALRHKDRLAEHQRLLVEALAAVYRGDHTTADQRIRQALVARPDLAESWLLLGDLTWSYGTIIGRPWVDAREAYERALALDPQNGIALSRLVAISARERRGAEFDSLTERLLRLDPSAWLASNTRGIRAVVRGDTAELARFVAELRTRPDRDAQLGAGIVTWFTEYDLSSGRRLWRLITEPSHSRGFRVMAHVTLAKIELTNGRRRAAAAELEAVRSLDAGSALEHRAYFALTRYQEASRSELTALRDSLERWDAFAAMKTEGDALLAAHRRAHPYFKLYLLGLLSARLGDETAALRYAAQLERADPSSLPGAFAADGGKFVRAEVAWRRGRPQEALTTLEGARFWTRWPGLEAKNTDDSPFYSHMHERFARAELLYELGREEEAIPWYRVYAYDLLYTAPARLRLAQIYERRGDRAKAAEHYGQFIELWKDCDPELRPLVESARQRLARPGVASN